MTYVEDSEQKKIFSENLRKYIERSGKTQKDIAIDLDVNPPTFSMWVKGKAIPAVSMIRKIADYFGIGITDLVDNKEDNGSHYYFDDDARELADFVHKNPAYRVLFDASRKVRPEDIDLVRQLMDKMSGGDADGDNA